MTDIIKVFDSVDENHFEVKSDTRNEWHLVAWQRGYGFYCTCEDAFFRGNGDHSYKCKHVRKLLELGLLEGENG